MASHAAQLYAERKINTPISPLIMMSDPRLPNVEALAQALPRNGAIIYRHFGDEAASLRARGLKEICAAKGHQFLIGKDSALAQEIGAQGLHLPQTDLREAATLREAHPNWIITAAVHDAASFDRAQVQPLDAIILSPVFQSDSPSAGRPLGEVLFSRLARSSKIPVIALGGVNGDTVHRLLGSGAAGLAAVTGILD